MITESKVIELFCMADDLASQISLNSRYFKLQNTNTGFPSSSACFKQAFNSGEIIFSSISSNERLPTSNSSSVPTGIGNKPPSPKSSCTAAAFTLATCPIQFSSKLIFHYFHFRIDSHTINSSIRIYDKITDISISPILFT